ncbi:MAG: potassium-transporting ATPase subunit KdpA [Pyrinomonadaceae bacterium]|nr:potassium-transporting ATPase subunit KdpA [Pyrinomonadaceae bacterium]
MNMNVYGIVQIVIYLVVLTLLTKPVGIYIARVYAGERTGPEAVFGPIERSLYRICRVDPATEMNWRQYGAATLMFSLVCGVSVYLIQRLQYFLPLNPAGLSGPSPDSSFNTAVSFMTNTNWQGYSGETTMSYFTQMTALTVQNFVSAAVGMALAIVFIRGIARFETDRLGNFWADVVRGTLYILLPISLAAAIFFVSQGVIQNFREYDLAQTLDGGIQTIAQGPAASQIAIKQLGTNGGGFFGVNSAHPFENPTPLTDFVQMLLILLIPAGFTYTLGRMVRSQRHGWAVYGAMMVLLIAGIALSYWAESQGNPLFPGSVDQAVAGGNMEGKEVRFGVANSALWATLTTAASNGSVNSMHDSFTPLGGLVPLLNIQLGEVIFGGVGAGMYGMLVMIILTVFIAGLMVGRTPEYLGNKIEAYDIKMAMLYILIFPLSVLGLTAVSVLMPDAGLSSLNNPGAHGLSEVLFAFTSATGNNGSAFAGLNANTAWYNTSLGIAILVGRFYMIIPVLAIAGSLAGKREVPASLGTFPVNTAMFAVLLVSVILIVGALTFFPVLSLSPILEHLQMINGQVM